MTMRMREYVDFDGGTRHDPEATAAAVQGARQRSVQDVRRAAEHWLRTEGLWVEGESVPERMRRLAHYRARLAKTPKPGPREWAQRLIERHRAGEPIAPSVLDMATDVLDLPRAAHLRVPDPPVARPDFRERQAGDTEAALAGGPPDPWEAWS